MKNMNRKGSAGSLIALFLAAFLIAILLVLMLGILKVTDYDAGVPATVFAVINMVILAVVYGMGGQLSRALGVGGYAPIAGMTGVYTIAQFVYMALAFKTAKPLTYILVSMIILFVYCVIVLPIGLNGAKNKNR